MKNLDYIQSPSWKITPRWSRTQTPPALLYTAIIRTRTHRQTAHAPYTRLLGHAALTGWPGRDLHLPGARLNREIPPECEFAKESELRESPYLIDSLWSLLR